MRLKTFYKKYNLSRNHFAKMLGITNNTLKKYENKEAIDKEVQNHIELGVKVLKELGFVYPDLRYVNNKEGIAAYKKNKKKADSLDKKFNTALKKAMK